MTTIPSPIEQKYREYHAAVENGDLSLAQKLWLEYMRAVEQSMREKAA